jgi:hypothetical protein
MIRERTRGGRLPVMRTVLVGILVAAGLLGLGAACSLLLFGDGPAVQDGGDADGGRDDAPQDADGDADAAAPDDGRGEDRGEGTDGDADDAEARDDGADEAEVPPHCGDGIVHADEGEECDDPEGNSDTEPNRCRTNCRLPWCGDGVADRGEDCDEGPGNSDSEPDRCRTDCTPARCGDAVVDTDEDCEDGNTTPHDGCEPDCSFTCDPDDPAACDDDEQCTADSCAPTADERGRLCTNGFREGEPCDDANTCTEGETCREAEGGCSGGTSTCDCRATADCAEHENGNLCDGTLICSGGLCLIDPATVVSCPTGGDTDCAHNECDPETGDCGMVDERDGTPCDDGQFCTLHDACQDGSCSGSGTPCVDAPCFERCDESRDRCVASADTTVCRPAVDLCDAEERCDGTSMTCPANAMAAAGTECRETAGACDVPEACTGAATQCPGDAFRPDTAECRAADGVCDAAESCTGSSADCPPDRYAPATTECRAADPAKLCDLPELCTGASKTCPAANRVAPSGTECRAVADLCDVREVCDGTSADCPRDLRRAAGTTCRTSSGICDLQDTCSGTSAECPDAYVSSGTECRGVGGNCDVPEVCPGDGPACPDDGYMPAGSLCALATDCRGESRCSGSGPGCPAGTPNPDGTVCTGGAASGICCSGACVENAQCCTSAECGCVGTSWTCEEITAYGESTCNLQEGCYWSTTPRCVGTGNPCEELTMAICTTCAGCNWDLGTRCGSLEVIPCGSATEERCCGPNCSWWTDPSCMGSHPDACRTWDGDPATCNAQVDCWHRPSCDPGTHACY